MVSDNQKFKEVSNSSIKISIITVCMNAADSIEKTVKSVINQSYKNTEYIIIDGASTDGTIKILDKYKENFEFVLSEPDKGIYNAMNKGIKKATGDFLIFLNASDTFYDDKVLEKTAYLLSVNPEVKFAFGNANYIHNDNKELKVYDNVKDIYYFVKNNICHQSIFYGKKLFDEYGLFSDEYKIYSDWDFNIKCLVKHREPCMYIPTCVCNFNLGGCSTRENNKNICQNENNLLIKKYYNCLLILIKLDRFLSKHFCNEYKSFKSCFLYQNIFEKFVNKKEFMLKVKVSGIN